MTALWPRLPPRKPQRAPSPRDRVHRGPRPPKWYLRPGMRWWPMQSSSWAILMCTVGQALQAVLTVPDLPRASSLISASVREEAPGTRLPEESPYQSVMPSREICCSMPAAITLTMWPSTSAAARLSTPATPPRVFASRRQITGHPVRLLRFWIKRIISTYKSKPADLRACTYYKKNIWFQSVV